MTEHTKHTEQQERITLPLARLRWLQEMGVAPALLRPYAPGRIATPRTQPSASIHSEASGQAQPTAQHSPAQSSTTAQDTAQHSGQQGAGRAMFEEMLRSMGRPQQSENKPSDSKSSSHSKRLQSSAAASKKDSESHQTLGASQLDTQSQRTADPAQTETYPESTALPVQPDKVDELAASTVQASSVAAPASTQVSEQLDSFAQWRQDLLACQACARCDERAVVLPGVGVRDAPDWFVLGGMPTRQDEGAGRVWSASAGRLLAAQLRSTGLNLRQQVYLSYALKCRSNHPQASVESITACRENFLQELSWVQPKRLLLLGVEAVQMLWGAEARLEDLRGTLQLWTAPSGRELPVVVTVDPTTLLLRPQQKARAWHDLLVLQQVMAEQAD